MAQYIANEGLKNFLSAHNIQSQAGFIRANGFGYGQVEPNHLSAQRTSEVYAQLPAAASINVLENGQFAKYNYADGVVDFVGPGEWMLVYNEIKLYREGQWDCEFAMLKDNYQARVYSPFGYTELPNGSQGVDDDWSRQSRYYNGVDDQGNSSITINGKTYKFDDVTAAKDPYEMYATEDPFHILSQYKEKRMPEGTTMVPRLFKTHEGDIFTTNMIADANVSVGNILYVGANGILTKTSANKSDTFAGSGDMQWQVVKVYTMPDHQPGVKVMRIK